MKNILKNIAFVIKAWATTIGAFMIGVTIWLRVGIVGYCLLLVMLIITIGSTFFLADQIETLKFEIIPEEGD